MKELSYPLVSVILPTYNVARYLRQCLDSIKVQSYPNFEVVIIIDGATDGSFEIAKEFCKEDKRFSVYWQENAGSGPARNAGLAYAKGDFVMFVDPDDWIEPECVETLMCAQQEKNFDLTISNKIRCVFDKNDRLISKKNVKTDDFEIFGYDDCRRRYLDIYGKGYISAPTRKIYKMSIIKENGVSFPPYRRCQDIVFNYRYYNYVSSIKSIDYHGYNYRISFKNNVGKVRHEYYKTIAVIYNDIKDFHNKWLIKLDVKRLASISFEESLYGYLQYSAYINDDLVDVLNDNTILEIIEKAKPKKIQINIIRKLLFKKHIRLAKLLLRTIYIIKKHK